MKLLVAAAAMGAALFMAPVGASAAQFGAVAKAASVEGTSGVIQVQSRRYRRSRTEVIQTSPGIDPTMLAIILGGGALTGGSNLGALALPLLLSQPQETVIVEDRGRRRRR